MNELYVTNYTPYLGMIIAILTVLPMILNIFVVKDRKNKNKQNILQSGLNILKYIVLVIITLILCINKNLMNIANANFVMGIMLFFYILHYELYIKFLIGGRREENLYSPFLYIKIPMQICISMGIIFGAIWTKNIILILLSLIFGILHIYTSYMYFKENFKEEKSKKKTK